MKSLQTQVSPTISYGELVKFTKEKVSDVAKRYGFSVSLDVMHSDSAGVLLRVHIGSPQVGMLSLNCYVTPSLWRGILSYIYLCKFLNEYESTINFSAFPTWSPHTACASALVTENRTKTVSLIIVQVGEEELKVVCYRDIWYQFAKKDVPMVGAFRCSNKDEFDRIKEDIYSFISFQSVAPFFYEWITFPKDAYMVLFSELKNYSNRCGAPLSFQVLHLPLTDRNFTKSESASASISTPTSLVSKRLAPLVGWWGKGWLTAPEVEHPRYHQIGKITSVFCYNTVLVARYVDEKVGQQIVYPIAAIDLLTGNIEILHYLGSVTMIVPQHRIMEHNMHPLYQIGEARTLFLAALISLIWNPKVWSAPHNPTQGQLGVYYIPYFPQILSVPRELPPYKDILVPVGAIEMVASEGEKLIYLTFVFQNESEILVVAQDKWSFLTFSEIANLNTESKLTKPYYSFVVKVSEFLRDPQTYLSSITTFVSLLPLSSS